MIARQRLSRQARAGRLWGQAPQTQLHDEKKQKMTLDGAHISFYDRRIKAIVDLLREDPESAQNAAISDDTARQLATRVLRTLDQIPQSAPHYPDSATPTLGAVPQDVGGVPDLDVLDMEICPACPHPLATHDAIGTRFCRATIVRVSPRGCTCPAH